MFEFDKLSPEDKERLIKARSSPLSFAEQFLKSPNPGPPFTAFKANYPQRIVLSSKKRDTWVCVHRRGGKSAAGNSYVIDSTTRRPLRIDQAAKVKNTYCFDFEKNIVESSIAEWEYSGKKLCVSIRLESGVALTLSTDHMVLERKMGWIPAGDVRIGQELLAASKFPEGDNEVSEETILQTYEATINKSRIPDEIFNYNNYCLHLYLKALFSYYGRFDHKNQNITLSFFNKNLAFDVQHLLYRFEIYSRVTKDGILRIDEELERNLFLGVILDADVEVFETKSSRRWDLVVNKKDAGLKDVYELCVGHPDTNFVANNTIIHNSFSFIVIALWHAVTQQNKKIHLFAPSSVQITEFFDVLDDWIAANPLLQGFKSPVGNTTTPPLRSFITGSFIEGHILGVNGVAPDKLRGITADICILDESQGFSDEDWRVLIPIMRGDLTRRDKIRCYIAGTLNRADGYYYKKIDLLEPTKKETVIKVPIDQNPDYTEEMVEEERLSVPDEIWKTEYLLQVTQADNCVFRLEDIESVFSEDWEPSSKYRNPNLPVFLTVDWDKVQAGTNILLAQYDPINKTARHLYHVEVPPSEMTYTFAIEEIEKLVEVFDPELIVVDLGSGMKQWEDLITVANRRTDLQLHSKLLQLPFNKSIKVPDPITEEDISIQVKPYLVDMLKNKFQKDLIRIPLHREDYKKQFVNFKIKGETKRTTKYSGGEEHYIDNWLMTMWAIFQYYENPYPENNKTFERLGVIQVPNDEDMFRSTMKTLMLQDKEDRDGSSFYFDRSELDTNTFGYNRSNF